MALTFQEIEGLREVYGEKIAHEITGQCGNKVFLRLGSPQTAEWASSFFGEQEWIEVRESGSTGQSSGKSTGDMMGHSSSQTGSSSNSTWNENRVVKKAVTPGEFLDLPKAGPGSGFFGFGDFASIGAFRIGWSWESIAAALPATGAAAAVEKRPAEHQYLSSWKSEDYTRLMLNGPVLEAPPIEEGALEEAPLPSLKDVKR